MKYKLLIVIMLLFAACSGAKSDLEVALELAGDNRAELQKVLDHYKDAPEKLAAAKFLIENMPAHHSYKNQKGIAEYYKIASKFLESDLKPIEQRDTLNYYTEKQMPGLDKEFVSDIKIMTADYLIYSIDHAFNQWKNRPWTEHLSFDEFCEWLLPYKTAENQTFDHWRDTLSDCYAHCLGRQLYDDEEYNTIIRVVDLIRSEMIDNVPYNGMFIKHVYAPLDASTMKRITFGRCVDYVNMVVSVYRSLGIPVVIDATPCYGRYRSGHSWNVIMTERGEQLPAEYEFTTEHGKRFFPAQRFPKVYRTTYAINRDRVKYRNESALKYPFDYCQKDITSQYTKTSDIEITTYDGINLAEKYCYISIFNGHNVEWSFVDYGEMKDGKACFKNIGRNILYIAQGFDGKRVVNISDPFILHQNGEIEYLKFSANGATRSLDIRRKYFQNRNVVEMRQRLHGGKIQGADNPDFRNAEDIFEIDDVYVLDPQPVTCSKAYKYYRYLSPDGSYGSIAELKFYDADTSEIVGTPIANKVADSTAIKKAFDGNYLSNFETEDPDGNWVGVKASKPQKISFVRIAPRSDDNDICPGDTYELLYYNGNQWISMGKKVATTNILHYDNVPSNTLYWVKDHTRGWDERPFLLREGDVVEWR